MPLTAKVQPIERGDIQLLLDDVKGAGALAEFAETEIEEAKAINRQALGYDPPVKIFVDGAEGAPLESVKPTGTIVADFTLANSVLQWIYENLVRASPIGPDIGGHYFEQHLLFADGTQINPRGVIPPATEYVFINAMPYARKIETGSSSKAPQGVYQTVATLARREFRDVAQILFAYRTVLLSRIGGGKAGHRGASDRNPAIIVRPK